MEPVNEVGDGKFWTSLRQTGSITRRDQWREARRASQALREFGEGLVDRPLGVGVQPGLRHHADAHDKRSKVRSFGENKVMASVQQVLLRAGA